MLDAKLVILPARNCRRSQKILAYLETEGIPFKCIPLESPQGQNLARKYGMLASPGILVNGTSINPFDILSPPNCTIDAIAVERLILQPLREHLKD